MDKFIELCSEESTISRDERQRQIVSLLDNGQFDPMKKKSSAGWLPLHYAARFGRADIVKLLITRYGCDPHIQTRDKKYTALHIASEHSLLEVVETLLQHIPDGVPAKRDKDGNTPLHAACRRGSLEIVNRLTSKYSTNSIHEVNKAGSTPLGYAVKETKATIARFLFSQKQTLGNPEKRFSDFRATFPSFKYKQSLDHPVSIFVMGKRQTGKSTLIKSIQVEGYISRTIGVFKTTSGVEHHSGGIVPSDVSSNGYGRAKFYELASCLQSTQENIFLSLEKSARAIFVITLSFKDEMKDMEANLLYWLSFIHNQYRSVDASVMPNIAVVGSFLFTKLGSLRLDNRHRLHLIYHRVLSGHSELCSHFHFLGKYSMDCRLSESPGMRQLRSALRRTSRELRPRGGEANIPSSCYVLLSALHDLRPAPSDLPVLRLSDIEREITQRSSLVPLSLVSLLPNHGEGLQPLLDKLVERKAILVLDHLNRRDPWVIFDEYKLISQIDSTLIERALRITESNPGIMSVDMLLQCLTPLSNSLPKDVLLNILHHFKITEVMAHGNDTKCFLPSVLKISPSSELPLAWNLDDGNYTLGFAQCILPQSNQLTPVFMPRFLYFMLYELFVSTENSDFDSVVMSHSALYVQLTPQLQVYVTIDSSAIILHMRCSESGVFTCLQYRNQFESIIHQQRALLQPNLKITEYIVPMEGLSFPIKKIKYVHAYGIQVNNLKNVLTKKSNSTTTESLNKLRSFEPYEWLSKLQKEHLDCLLDPRLTNVEVSKAFFRDLAKCVGGNWKTLLDYSELLQDFETNTSSDPEEPSGEDSRVSNQHPTYGRLFELFSSMSIFQTTLELISALKVRCCNNVVYINI